VEEPINDYKKTIMVVDDEKMIINLLSHNLKKEGYNVIEAYDGVTAVEMALEKKPDLILLDVMIPRLDGLSVCKKIKNVMNVPILMVTAKDAELDKILGLELGADDYVTKPFSVRELIARVKANLRKFEINKEDVSTESKVNSKNIEKPKNVLEVSGLVLDLDKFDVIANGKKVELTLREFELLKYLATDPGQVVSREALLEKVWGYEYYGDIRTVDVTVRRIREKIEKDTSNPRILMTKRSVGYYIANI